MRKKKDKDRGLGAKSVCIYRYMPPKCDKLREVRGIGAKRGKA